MYVQLDECVQMKVTLYAARTQEGTSPRDPFPAPSCHCPSHFSQNHAPPVFELDLNGTIQYILSFVSVSFCSILCL